MNTAKIQLNIGDREFTFAYEIPDAAGTISATDLNERWIDEHLRTALRGVIGKMFPLQARPVIRVPVQPQRRL